MRKLIDPADLSADQLQLLIKAVRIGWIMPREDAAMVALALGLLKLGLLRRHRDYGDTFVPTPAGRRTFDHHLDSGRA